ncbi:MAG TPA: sulfite exporter TauE/SafE family protein [Paenalcaligenes sp.]|nr:sulfite exporter TauE/SafE family protein [Paenalcaligenes sp.]
MDLVATVALLLVAGALIGFLGGVVGIGGGLLAIPFLVLVMGFEQQAAQGSALLMVLPAVLLTLYNYHKMAPIPLRQALAGASTSVVFTWFGAKVALGLDPIRLQYIYAGFIFCLALYYFYQSKYGIKRVGKTAKASDNHNTDAQDGNPVNAYSGYHFMLVGMLSGTAGGIFAVGGSVVVVPLLTTVFGFSQFRAQALGLTMIVPGIIVAILTYAYHGQVYASAGLPLAVGSLLMVPLGVRVAYRLAESRLRFIFGLTLLGITFLMFSSVR